MTKIHYWQALDNAISIMQKFAKFKITSCFIKKN